MRWSVKRKNTIAMIVLTCTIILILSVHPASAMGRTVILFVPDMD
jgi:hypothetical protein